MLLSLSHHPGDFLVHLVCDIEVHEVHSDQPRTAIRAHPLAGLLSLVDVGWHTNAVQQSPTLRSFVPQQIMHLFCVASRLASSRLTCSSSDRVPGTDPKGLSWLDPSPLLLLTPCPLSCGGLSAWVGIGWVCDA